MGGQKSSCSFHTFHSFSKSFSLAKLDDWKDKNILNESEHSITKSLVTKALKIKAIQLEQHVTTTTASVPRARTRLDSIHSQYEWTQYGKDVTKQDVDEDQLADGCCSICTNWCCPRLPKISAGEWFTLLMYGYGPDIVPPTIKEWRNQSSLVNQRGNRNLLYRTLMWIGRSSGPLLGMYGGTLFVAIVAIIVGIYSNNRCIPSLHGANAAIDQDNVFGHFVSVILVSISQLIGGGTAPGTVKTDIRMCAITAASISMINVGLRSLLFAVGLNALQEVEPEMQFSSKASLVMRNGVPTLLLRFCLPDSDCAIIEQVYGWTTSFLTSKEGESMTKTKYMDFMCFPVCSMPITASHAIDQNSPLRNIITICPDGCFELNRDHPEWNVNNFLGVSVLAYDTISERMIRRIKVFNFSDMLVGHQFADLYTRGFRHAIADFQPRRAELKNMNITKPQKHFEEKWRAEAARVVAAANATIAANGDPDEKNDQESKVNVDSNDPNDSKNVVVEMKDLKAMEDTDTEDTAIQKRKSEKENPDLLSLEEIEHFSHSSSAVYMSSYELNFLKSIVHKCYHSEFDEGEKAEAFARYLKKEFVTECKRARVKELEWKERWKSYLNEKCHWKRGFGRCWSCRCFDDRSHYNMSDLGTAIMTGTFPDHFMDVINHNKQLSGGCNPLYKITRCLHIGDLRMIFSSLFMCAVTIAVLIALAYTDGECFRGHGADIDRANSTTNVLLQQNLTMPFGSAFTSTFIQLSTGVPSDPLRQDRAVCALLILMTSVANIFLRVLVFSVGLHALERAKPNIVFGSQMILKRRDKGVVLQVRVCAPSAPALQVLQCKLYLVSGKISDEGEKFGSVTELATSTTPTLIVPSVRFCFCFFFSFWGQY